jgi:hypothetical protein
MLHGDTTVDTLLDLVAHMDGLELGRLKPSTILLVWTWNSCYQLVLEQGADGFLQGGSLFHEPTPAHIVGARVGRSLRKSGWIAVGLEMEFRLGDKFFVTSPVVAIAMQSPNTPLSAGTFCTWRASSGPDN